ncbi:MAG: energy transducer TonB, partial [Myxococcaceae bacterium]|nr:energy transducer TonB [Myxococcaceae bacterium]
MHAAVAQSLLVRRPTVALPFVALSFAAHALVVIVAVVIGLFHRPPPINLDQKPIKASLVRLGKPRDKKLLPRKE